jgi:hypothetical protein
MSDSSLLRSLTLCGEMLPASAAEALSSCCQCWGRVASRSSSKSQKTACRSAGEQVRKSMQQVQQAGQCEEGIRKLDSQELQLT